LNRTIRKTCLLIALVAATSLAQENWTQQFPANSPSPRHGAAMAYDAVHQQTVLFGGICSNAPSSTCNAGAGQETWLWNGSNWNLASSSGPASRFYSVMAWDPIRQRVVLFGGNSSSGGILSDTWEWDGTTWSQLASGGPSFSNPSYMAYDPLGSRIVLLIHGDYVYGTFVPPQTWFLSSYGNTWTRQLPTHPTFNLDDGGIVYDPNRQHIVMQSMDMLSSGTDLVSNTYVLAEGTPDWVVQSPLHSPPPMFGGASYSWDGSSKQIMRFGGSPWFYANGNDSSDTWEWSGIDWTQLTPATHPYQRDSAAMAYDAARQQVVLFGGESVSPSPTTDLGDTWTFQGIPSTQVIITVPAGVQFTFNGQTYTGSQTINVAPGSYTLSIVSPQAVGVGTQAVFASWSDGGAQTHTVNVEAPIGLTGTFKNQYLLTTSANPTNGGTVTQLSVNSNGPYYDAGTLVSVFESPAAGFSFTGWSGACGGTGACLVTMNAPATVTGSFLVLTYPVTVNVPPGVKYSILGFTLTGSATLVLPAGSYSLSIASQQVSSAGTQETFVSWSDGGAQAHNLVVTSSAVTVTGTFTTQYLLTAIATPAGHGSVVGGGWYAAGSPVGVLAVAAPGYTFQYWSGACSGSTCLVFMTGPLTVTANFSPPLTWVQLFPTTSPPPRSASAMVWDTARLEGVLFGGYQTSALLNDTWVFNGTNWSAKSPVTSPSPRNGHRMVYDSANNLTVLFGGGNGNSLSDTWVWNGTNWIQESPANSPSPRYTFGMAYDAARAKTVLFGGSLGNGHILNDTWLWDGLNWTQVFPAHVPAVRSSPAMAYDATRQVTVLFGGLGTNSVTDIPLNDTWIWNGSDWVQQAPASSPLPRSDAGMAYDASHQQMLLFGGGLPNGATLGDTWTWDGTNWTQRPAALSPSTRSDPAMAFDAVHLQPVLFGGSSFAGIFGDTWEWVAPTVSLVAQPPYVINTNGSAFFEIGVQLQNQGNVPVTNLSISSALFAGVTASSFVTPTSIAILNPGASAFFTAQFPLSAIPVSRVAAFIAQGTYSAAGVTGSAWTENIRALHIQ
jgi:hypothetical protein